MAADLGVAVAGFGWMGRVHTHAYARVRHHFLDLALAPRLVAVADNTPGRAEQAAAQYGFQHAITDWNELAAAPEVDAVSITSPNSLHREMGVKLASAGKHIWIEKPAGVDSSDTRAILAAVSGAGVQSSVGFNYRNPPAVALARDLISSGEIGTLTDARFRFLSDYAAHPDGALSWRYEIAGAGHGVLGDLAPHAVDLAWYLIGNIVEVVADSAIFIGERPRASGATRGHMRATGGDRGKVENEDWASGLLRFSSGARGSVEVSRVAVGEQNNYGFVIHGSKGSVAWDFRRSGELRVSSGSEYQDQPVRTILVGPESGLYGAFQPGSAISMGYDDLKVIEAANFLRSIAEHRPHGATITDALRAAMVVDALVESVDARRWVSAG